MDFSEPHKVYTAESNVEAHLIVNMLVSNGIEALVDEDQSGVNFWFGGRIGQYYLPNIWVEKSTSQEAAQLIRDFEQKKLAQNKLEESEGSLAVECEECGKQSEFAQSLNGTTQECPHCYAYLDVGELDWDEDFGEPED